MKSNNHTGICPVRFAEFLKNFSSSGVVYVEDSVLWYALDRGVIDYISMSLHERINFKQSYFKDE